MITLFTHDEFNKEKLLKKIIEHELYDKFRRGKYVQFTPAGALKRGCTLGCTVHSLHLLQKESLYPSNKDKWYPIRKFSNYYREGYCIRALINERTNIPMWLLSLQEAVFESSSKAYSTSWTRRFIKSLPERVDEKIYRGRIEEFLNANNFDWEYVNITESYEGPRLPHVLHNVSTNKKGFRSEKGVKENAEKLGEFLINLFKGESKCLS